MEPAITRLATFSTAEAAVITGVPVQRQADLRRYGHMPPVHHEVVSYDLFGLARLALIRVATARGIGPQRLASGAGGFGTVAIVRGALLCPDAWNGADPITLGARAWANLVSNAIWHHASRRNLPSDRSGRFLLWWGDDGAELADDFSPEVWAREADDRTQSVIIFDTHSIGASLAQAGRPLVFALDFDGSAGRPDSEGDLGKTAEVIPSAERKATRPALDFMKGSMS